MLTVLNGPTIEAGESLSDGIDCSAGQLVRITMPPEWDGDASLTFQFSTDGVMYNDMYGLDGYAVKVDVVAPGSGVIIPESIGRAIAFIKFRSGTAGNPVEQREQRTFAVAILTAEEAAAPPARSAAKKKRTFSFKKKKAARR